MTRDGRELIVGSSAGVGICPLPAMHPCRLLREANGLADDDIHSLFEDREGSLWIGSEGGLSRLVRRDLWSYGEREGLPDRQVYALAADGSGGIWAGTVRGLGHLSFGPHGEPRTATWRRDAGLPGGLGLGAAQEPPGRALGGDGRGAVAAAAFRDRFER